MFTRFICVLKSNALLDLGISFPLLIASNSQLINIQISNYGNCHTHNPLFPLLKGHHHIWIGPWLLINSSRRRSHTRHLLRKSTNIEDTSQDPQRTTCQRPLHTRLKKGCGTRPRCCSQRHRGRRRRSSRGGSGLGDPVRRCPWPRL